MPVLPKLMWKLQYLLFNSSVPGSCKIVGGVLNSDMEVSGW